MKNIAVVGVGGVGGYFGGKIARYLNNYKDNNLYFVARGNHFKEIKENGLRVKTNNEGEFTCRATYTIDDISELPILDICFVCVKEYDLENVLMQLKIKVNDKTKIIALLNGVDIYERVRSIINSSVIFPACVYVGTHIEKPGVVSQNGGSCTIIFGRDPQNKDVLAEEICELFDKSFIKYTWTKRHIEEIWSKFMFIASYGLVTANYNKTLGEVIESKEYSKIVKEIMNKIYEISRYEEIDLPNNIVETSYNKAKNFPYETKTSFQRDFELRDKYDERELFSQSIINLGKKNNVDVKIIENILMELNEKKRVSVMI